MHNKVCDASNIVPYLSSLFTAVTIVNLTVTLFFGILVKLYLTVPSFFICCGIPCPILPYLSSTFAAEIVVNSIRCFFPMLAVGILVKSFGTFFVYLPYDSLSNCVVPFFFCRGNHSQMVLFLSSLFVAGNIVKSYLTGTSFCSVSYGYLQCFGSGSCESVNTGNWPRSGSVNSELWNRPLPDTDPYFLPNT